MSDWLDLLQQPFHFFVEPHRRIHWFYLVVALLVARILYLLSRNDEQNKSLVGFFGYIFPKSVYLHPSAVNDYFYFYANNLLKISIILPLFSVLSINITTLVSGYLNNLSPIYQNTVSGSNIALAIFFTVTIGLVSDLSIFLAHYLQHRVPILWEFHKVHHSAQVLTPITVYRMHPVDDILVFGVSSIFVGTLFGVYQYIFDTEVSIFNIAGTNLLFVIFYLCIFNLRHSHFWVSYGPLFSRIFISPAQHQIHHSSDIRHRDKNLGFLFTFWDTIFGTLYVPSKKENIVYGINQKEDEKFREFWSLYLMPFINLKRNFKGRDFFKPKNFGSILFFGLIVGLAIYFSNTASIDQSVSENVFMDDMTWPEIKTAIDGGSTTVLVPTGGTEQNGPHLILGKHNYVVRYTCGKIAEKIGNTLVAPTITYVPEGNIDPPDGHMQFSGTLSVSDEIFADLLESTAKSLKTHGFKLIAFVGDSGGNQTVQMDVAKYLNDLWRGQGVFVAHINEYYDENGQTQFLLNKGYRIDQIGSHAGIRDTSELMAVFPQGVRNKLLADNRLKEFSSTGANGDSSHADAVLGNYMLNLKINSAVNQINKFLKNDEKPGN